MTTATGTVTLTIPIALAPNTLSKNGRAHWRERNRVFQELKSWAKYSIDDLIACEELDTDTWPWTAAWMDIDWRFSTGRTPDDDNVTTRLSAVRDAFEATGIVRNDQHIRIRSVTITRVKQSDDPAAIVTLERA